MKNIAVILSGCGVQDGSEIHEAVCALLAIAQAGAQYQCFAPDRNQLHVVNHLTSETSGEQRNILVEAARIARGNILPLDQLDLVKYDAIFFPGGFGAAKNLCDFAINGKNMLLAEDIKHLIISAHASKKPIAALCIAPVLLAKVIAGAKITIGSDANVVSCIKSWGAEHQNKDHGEIVIDRENLLVTTPCYMLEANIAQVYQGVHTTVNALLELCD